MDDAPARQPRIDERMGRLAASPEDLVRNLLRIMTAAAAGDRGVILKQRRGGLIPIASVYLTGARTDDPNASEVAPALTISILQRVLRARQPVQISPASPRPGARLRGLCLPLIHGGKVTALLYIERSQQPGRFTTEQRRLVALLAHQAATTMKVVDSYGEEIRALQAKVNPQFLHNSLSVIAELVTADAPKAEGAILMLSRLYRYVLNSSPERVVTLAQEVAMTRDYLTLERYRFGDRMRVEIVLEGPIDRVHIPCLILQMLVENSVSHSVATKVGEWHVRIEVSVDQSRCRLRVEDDGSGWHDHDEHLNPALRRVKERLTHNYPRRHSFRIHRGKRTVIEIRIPRARLAGPRGKQTNEGK